MELVALALQLRLSKRYRSWSVATMTASWQPYGMSRPNALPGRAIDTHRQAHQGVGRWWICHHSFAQPSQKSSHGFATMTARDQRVANCPFKIDQGIVMKRSLLLALALGTLTTTAAFAGDAEKCGEVLPRGMQFSQNCMSIINEDHINLYRDFSAINRDGTITAVIEIPAGTNAKWETDPVKGTLAWELKNGVPRVIKYLGYVGNYGMVPRTVGGDGDPLDVLVIGGPQLRGTVAHVKLVGAIKLDESGKRDDKLIAVLPGGALDVAGVNTLKDLDAKFPGVLDIIETWFLNYKGPGAMLPLGFADYIEAKAILDQAVANFK
jgi:inorganic pyrophosphatase